MLNETLLAGPPGEPPSGSPPPPPFPPSPPGRDLQSAFSYSLYDIAYHAPNIDGWDALPADITAHSLLWSEPNAFTHTIFLENAKRIRAPNSPYFSAWFVLMLIATLIVFFAVMLPTRIASIHGPYVGTVWGIVLAIAVVLPALELAAVLAWPAVFLRVFPVLIGALALLAMIPAIVLKSYGSIGFAVSILIVAVFYYFFTVGEIPYATAVLGLVCKRFVKTPVVLALLTGGLAAVAFSLLYGFLTWFVFIRNWSDAFYVAAVVVAWLTARVFGEVAYQVCAHYAAVFFFTSGRSEFREEGRNALAGRRALWQNFGIVCFNGLFLPLFGPFYTCAHTGVSDLAARLKFAPAALLSVYRPIHAVAVRVCRWADSVFGWPDRRGSIYSAVFGVPRVEGCRRVAENAARKYTRVFDKRCCVDSILGFTGIAIETIAGFLAWAIVGALLLDSGRRFRDGWQTRRLAGGWAFFTAFAVLHVGRMVVAALVDTLFVCFTEGKRHLLDPGFEAWLEGEYRQATRGSEQEGNQEA
jgi:hypothetical protein